MNSFFINQKIKTPGDATQLVSKTQPVYTISVTQLERFQQCPYLYKYEYETNPPTTQDQQTYNWKQIQQNETFQTGDQREEIANAYIYGEKLWDAALKNRLYSKQRQREEQSKQMIKRAELLKSELLPEIKTNELFPLSTQKKMVIFFADMTWATPVQLNDTKNPNLKKRSQPIPITPMIKLTWTLDWLWNNHNIEDCKTSKAERDDITIKSKLQMKIYPWMYAIYKRGTNLATLNSTEKYSFKYRIFTKHKEPRYQVVEETTTYAETTAEVMALIQKLSENRAKSSRPTNKTFKCKMCSIRHACPLFKLDEAMNNNSNWNWGTWRFSSINDAPIF